MSHRKEDEVEANMQEEALSEWLPITLHYLMAL